MIKSVLLLWYQKGDNFGDVLLFQTTRNYLTSAGIEVCSHEVGADARQIIEQANRHDFLLFAGGGIIESSAPPIIRMFSDFYKLLQVPYGVIGLGIAEFDYSSFSSNVKLLLDNAKFFYVRDNYSKNRLTDLVGDNNSKCSADCVFSNKQLTKYGSNIDNEVGINLRDLPYKHLTGDFDKTQLNHIFNHYGSYIVIPDSSDEQWKKLDAVKNNDVLSIYNYLDRGEKISTTINEMRRCEIIIAMRFHVVLVAAILGIVPIPIVYHVKVQSLVESLGIQELSVGLDQLENIPEKVKILKNNYEKYRKIIAKNVAILRKKSDAMYIDIIKQLSMI